MVLHYCAHTITLCTFNIEVSSDCCTGCLLLFAVNNSPSCLQVTRWWNLVVAVTPAVRICNTTPTVIPFTHYDVAEFADQGEALLFIAKLVEAVSHAARRNREIVEDLSEVGSFESDLSA